MLDDTDPQALRAGRQNLDTVWIRGDYPGGQQGEHHTRDRYG